METRYALLYPSKVLVSNKIIKIKIQNIFTKPYVYPSIHKVMYPVYLRLGLNVTPQKFWEVLKDNGFRLTPMQSGNFVLSAYKPLTNSLDLHVKLTEDKKVLAEVEPHRYSLQHLLAFVFPVVLPSLYEVKSILDEYGVEYRVEFNGKECSILENMVFYI